MNFRTTTLLFGLLLTTLWVFGLMIAHKKTSFDRNVIVPSMQGKNVNIDKILIQRKEDKKDIEIELGKIGDYWYLKAQGQQARIEGYHANNIIRAIQDAKHEDLADVSKELKDYGLTSPQITVTLFGKDKDADKEQEWKFYIGAESADKSFYYVTSSDQPDKAFAVAKTKVKDLLVTDPDSLRSKRLYDFIASSVTGFHIKQGTTELELKRGEGGQWSFIKPPLGFAGYETAGEDDSKMPKDQFHPQKKAAPKSSGGVKSLLDDVVKMHVEEDQDFEPLGKPAEYYALAADKAAMRIDITTEDEKKQPTVETLLIGKDVTLPKRGKFYYARLASANDNGVMRISAKYIEPIEKALKNPYAIRSLDLAFFSKEKADVIYLKQVQTETTQVKDEKNQLKNETKTITNDIKFFKQFAWEMFVNGVKKDANQNALAVLLNQLDDKKTIVAYEFDQLPDAEKKKKASEVGLDAPNLEIEVYVDAITRERLDPKKADTDKKDPFPALKKDVKPVVKLEFGKTEDDLVHVRRSLQDGTISYFTVKKDFVEKLAPPVGIVLAYLDVALPPIDEDNIESARITRKGAETIDLERRNQKSNWYIKDPREKTGFKPANSEQVEALLIRSFAHLRAEKWLKKIDANELEKTGLDKPELTVTLTVKKYPLASSAAVSLMGMLASADRPFLVLAAADALTWRERDKGETITFKFGKETDLDKKKLTYAERTGADMPFMIEPRLVKTVAEFDPRDRSYLANARPELEALYLAGGALHPVGLLMFASPQFTGLIHTLDPEKVKEIYLAVRTPYELRQFAFARNVKDKSWTDLSKLEDFHVDGDKVNHLVKEFCVLKTDRFAVYTGGPRPEQKLSDKEATAKIELTMDDGRKYTLRIGALYQQLGYFATSSDWPETVFFLPPALIEPLLRSGAASFGKERAL
jgi:hypothetical protein